MFLPVNAPTFDISGFISIDYFFFSLLFLFLCFFSYLIMFYSMPDFVKFTIWILNFFHFYKYFWALFYYTIMWK